MEASGSKGAVGALEVHALLLLTFTAGVFDAISFVGLDQVFVALITGNILLIGFALSEPGLTIGGPLVAIAAFFIGAAVTGRVDLSARSRDELLLRTVAAEGLLLVPAFLIALGYHDQELRRLLLLALLGAAMGVRNETVREIAVPQLRTTLQTLALSAVATELARRDRLSPPWFERVGGILVQFAGAAIGGLLAYKTDLVWPLLLLLTINATAFVALRMRIASAPATGGPEP